MYAEPINKTTSLTPLRIDKFQYYFIFLEGSLFRPKLSLARIVLILSMSTEPEDLEAIPRLKKGTRFGAVRIVQTRRIVCYWVYVDDAAEQIRYVYLLYQSWVLQRDFHERVLKKVRAELQEKGWKLNIIWYILAGAELASGTSPEVLAGQLLSFLATRQKLLRSLEAPRLPFF